MYKQKKKGSTSSDRNRVVQFDVNPDFYDTSVLRDKMSLVFHYAFNMDIQEAKRLMDTSKTGIRVFCTIRQFGLFIIYMDKKMNGTKRSTSVSAEVKVFQLYIPDLKCCFAYRPTPPKNEIDVTVREKKTASDLSSNDDDLYDDVSDEFDE